MLSSIPRSWTPCLSLVLQKLLQSSECPFSLASVSVASSVCPEVQRDLGGWLSGDVIRDVWCAPRTWCHSLYHAINCPEGWSWCSEELFILIIHLFFRSRLGSELEVGWGSVRQSEVTVLVWKGVLTRCLIGNDKGIRQWYRKEYLAHYYVFEKNIFSSTEWQTHTFINEI